MIRRFARATVTVTFALGLAVTAAAQGNSQGRGHGKGKGQPDASADGSVEIVFSAHDREAIRGYFHDNYSNLPPGLAKRGGNLPPGLQKHIERDGTLPPGLQKRLTPFPVDLDRRLTRLPGVYVRVVLGADVLILNRETQRIMDVIHDIVRP